MIYEKKLFGHTIEVRGSGSGSLDPWSGDFARSINLSLMCTSDMAEFMLIDGEHIYKFDSSTPLMELHSFIEADVLDSWEQFENEWLTPLVKKRRVHDWGLLSEHIEGLKQSKKRDIVWKSIPQNKRREVYEYLKTLSREETEKWYERKFEELGIKDMEIAPAKSEN